MLYLHIGLHKTATTSLQKYIFPKLDGISYIGRNPKGYLKSDSTYLELCKYCFSRKQDSAIERSLNNDLLRLSQYQPILISEEWFTNDYSHFYKFNDDTWQNKLTKLSNVIKGLNYKILITIRDPSQLSYSKYIEFHSVGIQKIYPSFKRYLFTSNDAKVFEFDNFFPFINKKFNNITLLEFNDIINGTFQPTLELFFNRNITHQLGEDNKKKGAIGNQLIVQKKRSRFYHKISDIFPKKVKNKLKSMSSFHLVNKIVIPNNEDEVLTLFNQKFPFAMKAYQNIDNLI